MKESPLFTNHVFFCNATSFKSAINKLEHQVVTNQNLVTIQKLVDNRVISVLMAKKAVSSGLRMSHLSVAGERSATGIKDLCSECTSSNRPRVTCVKVICDPVQKYMVKQL